MYAVIFWCLLCLSVLAFAVAAFNIFKHWQEIRLMDPNSIKEEVDRKRRDEMVEMRFKRLQQNKTAPLKYLYNQAVISGKTFFHRGYLRLVRLNRFYEQAKRPFAQVAPSIQERIKSLNDEARSLARDLKWADAEKRYLEVLTLDNRNVDAYKGIALVYLKQKLYPQARETFDYLIKSKKADDVVFSAMAEIYENEEKWDAAEDMRVKAVELRPRLANRHAELAHFYFDRDDLARAWPSAKRATDLDGKSAKYQELALECSLGLGDWNEAKRRFDKLRLLSEDQQRLQKLRERLDAIKPSS